MVYHGKVKMAQNYFWALGYDLPEGESLADWLIDISTGSLKPAVLDDSSEDDDSSRNKKQSKKERKKGRRQNKSGVDTSDEEDANIPKFANDEEVDPEMLATDAEKEAARRQKLYDAWRLHFRHLSRRKRSLYRAPKPFDLPSKVDRPAFLSQLGYQIHRLVLLAYRNWYSKLLDTTIIVGAVILVSLLDGVVTPTVEADMNTLDYYSVAEPRYVLCCVAALASPLNCIVFIACLTSSTADTPYFLPTTSGSAYGAAEALLREFPKLFQYALLGNVTTVRYVQGLPNDLFIEITTSQPIPPNQTDTLQSWEFLSLSSLG